MRYWYKEEGARGDVGLNLVVYKSYFWETEHGLTCSRWWRNTGTPAVVGEPSPSVEVGSVDVGGFCKSSGWLSSGFHSKISSEVMSGSRTWDWSSSDLMEVGLASCKTCYPAPSTSLSEHFWEIHSGCQNNPIKLSLRYRSLVTSQNAHWPLVSLSGKNLAGTPGINAEASQSRRRPAPQAFFFLEGASTSESDFAWILVFQSFCTFQKWHFWRTHVWHMKNHCHNLMKGWSNLRNSNKTLISSTKY